MGSFIEDTMKKKVENTVGAEIDKIDIPNVTDLDGIRDILKGGFNEILANKGGIYYQFKPFNMQVVIKTVKVKPKIIGIIDSIANKIEDEDRTKILSDLKVAFTKFPDTDIVIDKKEITAMTANVGGKRKTKKKYKNTIHRRTRGGGGFSQLTSLVKDATRRIESDSPSSVPTSSDPTSSVPTSSDPTSSDPTSSVPTSTGATSASDVPSRGGAEPYTFTLMGNNITPAVREEITGKICEMIADSLNSKLAGFKTDLSEISNDVLKKAQDNLMKEMELVFLGAFNDKLDEFKKQIVDNPKSENLMQEIIYELGLQFNEALASKRDIGNAPVYAKVVEAEKAATAKVAEATAEAEEAEKRKKVETAKTAKVAEATAEAEEAEKRKKVAEAEEEQAVEEEQGKGGSTGGRKTKQNKTKRKKQNKTRRKNQNKTKRKK